MNIKKKRKENRAMKMRDLFLSMAALLTGALMTACTNDDEPQAAETQTGYVEFTLTRGADTRTDYAVADNGLSVTWAEGDQVLVLVFDDDGVRILTEVFALKSGAGTTTATFYKEDSEIGDKTGYLNIIYLPTSAFSTEDYTVDLSTQAGTLANLGDYDIIFFDGSVTDGAIALEETEPMMYIFRFKANDIDFGTGDSFVFSGDWCYNTFSLLSGSSKGDITVKNVKLTDGKLIEDLYVAVYSWGYNPETLTVGSKKFNIVAPSGGFKGGKVYTFDSTHLTEVTE